MPLIDWLPSYNIGIAEIDIDNQQLAGMINQLHDSITKKNNQEIVNEVIRHLALNFQDHCDITTQVLTNINYIDITGQQESHKKFGRVLATYLQRLKKDENISAMELIGFLRNWFDKHTLIEDQRIKSFIKQKQKAPALDDLANSHIQPIRWNDSYNFNINNIDIQHHNLIDLFNKLYHAVELKMSKKIILRIIDTFHHHAVIHFKDEEKLMNECEYYDYEEHAKIHRQLIKEFQFFMKKIRNDDSISHLKILAYIHNWFINHFNEVDGKLLKYLKDKKATVAQA